jgi:hypothetical protein
VPGAEVAKVLLHHARVISPQAGASSLVVGPTYGLTRFSGNRRPVAPRSAARLPARPLSNERTTPTSDGGFAHCRYCPARYISKPHVFPLSSSILPSAVRP